MGKHRRRVAPPRGFRTRNFRGRGPIASDKCGASCLRRPPVHACPSRKLPGLRLHMSQPLRIIGLLPTARTPVSKSKIIPRINQLAPRPSSQLRPSSARMLEAVLSSAFACAEDSNGKHTLSNPNTLPVRIGTHHPATGLAAGLLLQITNRVRGVCLTYVPRWTRVLAVAALLPAFLRDSRAHSPM